MPYQGYRHNDQPTWRGKPQCHRALECEGSDLDNRPPPYQAPY